MTELSVFKFKKLRHTQLFLYTVSPLKKPDKKLFSFFIWFYNNLYLLNQRIIGGCAPSHISFDL